MNITGTYNKKANLKAMQNKTTYASKKITFAKN